MTPRDRRSEHKRAGAHAPSHNPRRLTRQRRVRWSALTILLAVAAALIVLAPASASSAGSFSISGSMEGSIQISNGDFVAGGYHFQVQSPTQTDVEFTNAKIVFQGTCSNGSSQNSLTIPLPEGPPGGGPWVVPANSSGEIPAGSEQDPSVFEASVKANVCGGSGQLNASSGATLSATVLTSNPSAQITGLQFHYRDPAAKGKGNNDCSASTSASLGSDVCGASWSGTISVTPGPIPPAPSITTTATPASIALGAGTVADTAHLAGGSNPTGSITFNLYGPSDSTCSSTPVFTTTKTGVSGDGDYTSAGYPPSQAGTYHWIASYSGDSDNPSATGKCGDANETVTVSPLTPAISTTAHTSTGSSPIALGAGTINDVAHLTGASNNAGGTITFKLYGPNDSNCSSGAIATSTATVNGNSDYQSASFTPTKVGTYQWTADYSGDSNNAAVSEGCQGANESVIVSPASPAITTTASANTTVPGVLTDTAHLSGATGNAGGTITFMLFGPDDKTCSKAPVAMSTVTVNGNGDYTTSPGFTATQAGLYQWTASYSGDSSNASANEGCGGANESTGVGLASPSITTTANPSTGPVGGSFGDTAQLSGGSNPTGQITFQLYGPNDDTCSKAPVFTTQVTVNGNGSYTLAPNAGATLTQAGTYHWIATYGGDPNNGKATDQCSDASEQVTVTPVGPAISTVATPGNATLGGSVSDIATLTGGVNPTGSITFKLYGPNDTNCSAAPIFTMMVTNVKGNGQYTSASFTPTAAGTYYWVDSYSGDTNNAPASGTCGDKTETVVVSPLTPTISTTASAAVTTGGAISDVAHLGGGSNPTGSITFKAYGPNDSSCSAAPAFTTTVSGVKGDGDYTSQSFVPTQAGTYQWVASYSGDTNNVAVSGHCGDANEAVSVTTPPPGIALVKEQMIDGSGQPFTTATLTGQVGQKVDYEMIVTNTGQVVLTLQFTDPHCDAGTLTGPSGGLNASGQLLPGQQTTYTCSHILAAGDRPQFTNTATVTGVPPTGPPVGPVSSSVIVNIPAAGVAACVANSAPLHLTGKLGAKKKVFTATLKVSGAAKNVTKIKFTLDSKALKTVKANKSNKYVVTVNVAKLAFGSHHVGSQVTFTCAASKASVAFKRPTPTPRITPKFTG